MRVGTVSIKKMCINNADVYPVKSERQRELERAQKKREWERLWDN